MARYALDRHPNLEVVGITGSLGKTTTKEVVASVLGAHRRVLKSEGNLNSEIGLPMTVLNGLDRPYDIAVLEMAMYQVGDIRLLARLARPRVGVVTAVLPVHLERLGTIDRIQQAKQELVEELRDRVDRIRKAALRLPSIRTLALEWSDPPFAGGHWDGPTTVVGGLVRSI